MAKKAVHFYQLLLAYLSAIVGVVFAFLSHTEKKPDPIPNLYSPHSYMGLLALFVFSA